MGALLWVRILFSALDVSNSLFSSSNTFTLCVQLGCLFLLPFGLYLLMLWRLKDKNPLKTIASDFGIRKFDKKALGYVLAISFLTPLIISFFSSLWNWWVTLIGYNGGGTTTYPQMNFAQLILELAMTAILPSLFEEFTTRGLLMGSIKDRGEIYCIFITALLFALMHQNITQVGYTFVGGIIMTALAYYTRSIWPAVICHFVNNSISVLRTYARGNGGVFTYVNALFNTLTSNAYFFLLYMLIFLCFSFLVWVCISKLRKMDLRGQNINFISTSENSLACYRSIVKVGWRENIFLYAAILMNVIATAYSLVWGLLL
jgi:membrane protease YdiL (CAAX protease family)